MNFQMKIIRKILCNTMHIGKRHKMDDQKQVMEKIRKLLSLATSPEKEEAETAIMKAHELLFKYNLSMADINEGKTTIKEVVYQDGFRRKQWRGLLLYNIAKANYSALLTGEGYGGHYSFTFVGKEHNLQTCIWMSDYLLKAVERISRKEIPKNAKQKYRENYRLGMATGISYTLSELRAEEETGPESRSLILAEDAQLSEYLQEQGLRTKETFIKSGSKAFYNGVREGLKIPLNTQISQVQA